MGPSSYQRSSALLAVAGAQVDERGDRVAVARRGARRRGALHGRARGSAVCETLKSAQLPTLAPGSFATDLNLKSVRAAPVELARKVITRQAMGSS